MAMTSPAQRSEWRQRAAVSLCLVIGLAGLRGQRTIPPAGPPATPEALLRPIDLNHDPAWILAELPRIGPRRADAIVARRAVTSLHHPNDLLTVPGIGPGTVAAISPFVACHLDPGPTWPAPPPHAN